MSAIAAVVQMAINPKMPRINHPVNRLDCRSNLVSNQEQVQPWDFAGFPGPLEIYW